MQVNEICDCCRQHHAVKHFIDAYHASGKSPERYLCIECFGQHPISDWRLVELGVQILRSGKCEHCGDSAFTISGIPGPDRHVYCRQCAEHQLVKKWTDLPPT